MECNIGKKDQMVRALAGLLMIGLGVLFGSWLGAFGLIPLATALCRLCPFYLPLGLSTLEEASPPHPIPAPQPPKRNRTHLKKCDL